MTIDRNLDLVDSNLSKICQKYQKNRSDISLIAVSKTIETARIEAAINWGCKNFGENRIEETKEKWPELKAKYPQTKLHFIGHLQSKKAADAVNVFDFIHSLDSLKLAEILKKEMEKQRKFLKVFVQVNIGEEVNKSGIKLEEVDNFIMQLRNINFPIFGLMCIPPINKEASLYFALLHKIAKKHQIRNLSMGMSADYEAAIALNSNFIRIGSAIFG